MSQVNQVKTKTLTKKLMIKPKYINDKSYIEKTIKELENTCNEYGYIDKIHEILTITFDKFYEQSFSGSLLVDVEFIADVVSIKVDDEIECQIVKANEDNIIAEGTYPIYVIIDGDYETLSFIEPMDIIKVKILKWDISREKNLIKAIGKYISNKEMDIIENKEDNE